MPMTGRLNVCRLGGVILITATALAILSLCAAEGNQEEENYDGGDDAGRFTFVLHPDEGGCISDPGSVS